MKSWFLYYVLGVCVIAGCLAGKGSEPRITVWATGDSLKVKPHAPYQPRNHHWDGGSSTISLKGASNEWVAAQLILRSSQPASGIAVEAGDLVSEAGRIGRENIRLFKEHYVRVTRPTDRKGSTGKGEYPDPLIPFYDPYRPERSELASPINLEKKRNCPIWIDVFIPPRTEPGTYRGAIAIRLGKEVIKELPLELEVWGFALPDRKNLKVFFDLYAARWAKGEGLPFSFNDATWEVLKQYEIMAHEHGFSNGHWGLMPSNISDSGPVDWTLYDRYLGRVLDGTLFRDKTSPACWELPFPESWDPGERVLENYCRELVRHWTEKGWELESAFAYVWDERGPWNEKVKRYGEILREASADRINFFYTHGPHPNLYGVVDWWCPRASQYSAPLVQERQKLGEKGFFYHAGEPSVGLMCIDAVGLAFRTWAWMAWKYRADGFFDWSANFWGDSPYTDPLSFDTDNGNMYLFYPGAELSRIGLKPVKGPLSSFRMKMVRRGIQDYEYFYLAREAELDPDPVVNAVVRRGLGETGSSGIDPAAWSRDPEDWYEARDRLGEMIEEKINPKSEFRNPK